MEQQTTTVQKYDFGIWPSYLCRGRSPKEQVVIAWLWIFANSGTKWTLKMLSDCCGVSVNGEFLHKLAEAGLLKQIESADKTLFTPSTNLAEPHEPPPERKKRKSEVMPPWVFKACRIWERYHGVIGPKQSFATLRTAVESYGEDKVLAGLDNYARRTDAKFAPSIYKYVACIKQWMDAE